MMREESDARTSVLDFDAWVALVRSLHCNQRDAARDLLLKSYNQADIWREPVQLVAKVKLPRPKGQDINLQYKVWWTGPDKWRAEWSGANYSRVIVVNDGKQYRFSSAAVPPLPVLQFERALGALTGGGIGGYIFPRLAIYESTNCEYAVTRSTKCLLSASRFQGGLRLICVLILPRLAC